MKAALVPLFLLSILPVLLIPASAENVSIVAVESNPPGQDRGHEWVKLFNAGSQAVDLKGWIIVNEDSDRHRLTETISACGSITITFPKQFIDNKDAVLKLLNPDGDTVDMTPSINDSNDKDGKIGWEKPNPKCLSSASDAPPLSTPAPSPTPSTPGSMLGVTFVDLKRPGEAVLVTAPGGKTMLIDGGLASSYGQLESVLDNNNITEIDIMIATHADQDHIQGLTSVIRDADINVNQVLLSHVNATTKVFEEFAGQIKSSQIPSKVVSAGHVIPLDDSLTVRVISPPSQGISDSSSLRNTNSLVIHMVYGGVSFLFTGDATAKTEKWITDNVPDLDIDIMNGPHHGSHHSSTDGFIDHTTPKLVVFSADADNRYSHPHPDAIARYDSRNIIHYQTGTNGTIAIQTDSVGCSVLLADASPIPCYPGIDMVSSGAATTPAPTSTPALASPETRNIGVIVSVTGAASSAGKLATASIHHAVDLYNSHLESHDKDWRLGISVHDDGTDPARALDIVAELNKRGIKSVIGPLTSPALGHVEEYIADNDMLAISYGSSASSLAKHDRIFRLVVNETGLFSAYGQVLHNDGIKYAIPVFRDDLWGNTLNHSLVTQLQAAGITVREGVTYNVSSPDYAGVISRIDSQLHPYTSTGIILLTFDEIVDILDAAAANDGMLAAKWYGSNSIGQALADNTRKKFMSATGFVAPTSDLTPNYITHNIDQHVRGANIFAYTAYDAVFILAKAIDATGTANNTAALAAALPEIARTHKAAIGNTTLNSVGDLFSTNYTINTVIQDSLVPTASYSLAEDSVETHPTHISQSSPYGIMYPISGDWDGDGDDDVGTAGILNNGHYLFTLNANGTSYDTVFRGAIGATFQYNPGTLTHITGDWDADGDDDVGILGISASQVNITLNANGTAYDTVFEGTIADSRDYAPGTIRPLVGDWDGDGDDDAGMYGIVGTGMLGYVLVVDGKSATGGFNASGHMPGTMRIISGDWDGDGDDDIGYRGVTPSGLQHFVLYVDDTVIFDSFIGNYNFYVPGTMRILTGDWDGDGDGDIGTVGIDANGLQHFTLVANTTIFNPVLITAIGDADHYIRGTLTPLVGDWDADGDDDIGSAGILESGRQLFTLTPFNDGRFNTTFVGSLGDAHDYLTLRYMPYDVTILNTMPGQPITGPPVAAHNADYWAFREGTAASAQLQTLAENGNVSPMYNSMSNDGNVSDIARGNLLFANHTAALRIVTPGDHPYISFASMLDCTNDGFVGLDSAIIPATSESVVLYPRIYDAGTEDNTEDFADLPPSCQSFVGIGSNDAGSSTTNPALAENGVVHVHKGIMGDNDLVKTHAWEPLPVTVTVTMAP